MDFYADLITVSILMIYMISCVHWRKHNDQRFLELLKSSSFQFHQKKYIRYAILPLILILIIVSIVTWRLYHLLVFTGLQVGVGSFVLLIIFFCTMLWYIGMATAFKVMLSLSRLYI